jgi:hypothetical protein
VAEGVIRAIPLAAIPYLPVYVDGEQSV